MKDHRRSGKGADMKNLVLLTLGVLAVASACGATPSDSGRPNVLVLHVDQLRIDCLAPTATPT